MKIVEFVNVTKKYKNKVILDKISLSLEIGKCYMLVGGNGSGKSTLIKLILGLIYPNSGVIIKSNIKIGYVPERYNLPEFIKIDKFINLLSDVRKNNIQVNLLNEYYNIFDLGNNQNLKIKELSKGMLQKTVIIQALINDPDLYIFDEALNGLDPKMQDVLLKIINDLKKKNKTIIITSHYPKLYKESVDIIYEIKSNKIEVKNNI